MAVKENIVKYRVNASRTYLVFAIIDGSVKDLETITLNNGEGRINEGELARNMQLIRCTQSYYPEPKKYTVLT